MLYTSSNASQSAAVGGVLNLGSTTVSTCGCASSNGTSVSLQRTGYYKITVNASAAAASSGDITL